MIIFNLSNKSLNFQSLLSVTINFTVFFPILKDFSDEFVNDINECYFLVSYN